MNYLIQRLIYAIPVVLGITIIVFFILSLIPGDPATAILGSYATPENVKLLNEQLGLDKGLVQRYFIWLGNLLQGDFGRSFALNRPVLDEILERFNATLILSGTAFILCSVIGVLMGTLSAFKQYTLTDKIITFAVLTGISVPSFFFRNDDDIIICSKFAMATCLWNVRYLWRWRFFRSYSSLNYASYSSCFGSYWSGCKNYS